MTRILILGGYGVFGRRAAARLARVPGIELLIAGRDGAAAKALALELQPPDGPRVTHQRIDARELTGDTLDALGIQIVINTAGPYQARDYRVPEAAIEAKAHYIDLADARGYVGGITSLNEAARRTGVLVVSGASSVPALAAAVIDEHLPRFSKLTEIAYGISPGNSFDPGEATVASILGGAGRPLLTLIDGQLQVRRGWQPLVRHRFRDPDLATRWLGHCDVPDLDLFPARYPTLRTQRFLAGVEVKLFHGGIWLLSWLRRARLVGGVDRLAGPLLSLKRRLGFLGSDRGAMFMTLSGLDGEGHQLQLSWELIARQGHGPYIPAMPAVILAKKLAAGTLAERGAMPCLGLFTLDEFSREVADLDIRHGTTSDAGTQGFTNREAAY